MNNFELFCESLVQQVISSYELGITLEESEKLASKLIHAMFLIEPELKAADAAVKIGNSEVEIAKSSIRMDELKKHDKKPTEGFLNDIVTLDSLVKKQQEELDSSKVHYESLKRYHSVFKEAHIHYRGIAKGNN